MRFFSRKTTGSVLVIGWQASALAEHLATQAQHDLPYYVVSGRTDTPPHHALVRQIQADLNRADAVKTVFNQLIHQGHHPELVIFQAEPNSRDQSLTLSNTQLEQRWQQTGFSLFLWAQAAIDALQTTAQQRQPATFILLGSDLAIRPEADFAVDSALYAGMRAVMQSLAREFQPKGVHVVHVGLAAARQIQDVARLCWQLHQQPRNAWTHEVELVSGQLMRQSNG